MLDEEERNSSRSRSRRSGRARQRQIRFRQERQRSPGREDWELGLRASFSPSVKEALRRVRPYAGQGGRGRRQGVRSKESLSWFVGRLQGADAQRPAPSVPADTQKSAATASRRQAARARRRRAARAQAKVPRCRFDSARIFLRELLHRRPESGPSHRYPTAGMRTNPHSLKTNISRALPHIAAFVKTRAFRAGVVPQKGCWLLSGRRQKAEGRRAEGRGRRIVSSGGGGRGAQARGQKWCDAPSAPLACDAYLPTSFEAPET